MVSDSGNQGKPAQASASPGADVVAPPVRQDDFNGAIITTGFELIPATNPGANGLGSVVMKPMRSPEEPVVADSDLVATLVDKDTLSSVPIAKPSKTNPRIIMPAAKIDPAFVPTPPRPEVVVRDPDGNPWVPPSPQPVVEEAPKRPTVGENLAMFQAEIAKMDPEKHPDTTEAALDSLPIVEPLPQQPPATQAAPSLEPEPNFTVEPKALDDFDPEYIPEPPAEPENEFRAPPAPPAAPAAPPPADLYGQLVSEIHELTETVGNLSERYLEISETLEPKPEEGKSMPTLVERLKSIETSLAEIEAEKAAELVRVASGKAKIAKYKEELEARRDEEILKLEKRMVELEAKPPVTETIIERVTHESAPTVVVKTDGDILNRLKALEDKPPVIEKVIEKTETIVREPASPPSASADGEIIKRLNELEETSKTKLDKTAFKFDAIKDVVVAEVKAKLKSELDEAAKEKITALNHAASELGAVQALANATSKELMERQEKSESQKAELEKQIRESEDRILVMETQINAVKTLAQQLRELHEAAQQKPEPQPAPAPEPAAFSFPLPATVIAPVETPVEAQPAPAPKLDDQVLGSHFQGQPVPAAPAEMPPLAPELMAVVQQFTIAGSDHQVVNRKLVIEVEEGARNRTETTAPTTVEVPHSHPAAWKIPDAQPQQEATMPEQKQQTGSAPAHRAPAVDPALLQEIAREMEIRSAQSRANAERRAEQRRNQPARVMTKPRMARGKVAALLLGGFLLSCLGLAVVQYNAQQKIAEIKRLEDTPPTAPADELNDFLRDAQKDYERQSERTGDAELEDFLREAKDGYLKADPSVLKQKTKRIQGKARVPTPPPPPTKKPKVVNLGDLGAQSAQLDKEEAEFNNDLKNPPLPVIKSKGP